MSEEITERSLSLGCMCCHLGTSRKYGRGWVQIVGPKTVEALTLVVGGRTGTVIGVLTRTE